MYLPALAGFGGDGGLGAEGRGDGGKKGTSLRHPRRPAVRVKERGIRGGRWDGVLPYT